MLPVHTQRFPARQWPILIIFSILTLPFISLKLMGDQDKIIDIFLLATTLFCLILYICSKCISITIDNEGIEYRSILIKRSIAWKDIQKTSLAFEFHGKSTDFVWNFTSFENKSINFSAGFFSKSTLRAIGETVIQKCDDYVVKGNIRMVSKGKFPWYFF